MSLLSNVVTQNDGRKVIWKVKKKKKFSIYSKENIAASLVMTKQPYKVPAPEELHSKVLLKGEEKWRFCPESMKTHLSWRGLSETARKQTCKSLEQDIAIEGN